MILYGTGLEAEKFLFDNRHEIKDISYCIDGKDKCIKEFHNIEVLGFDEGLKNRRKEIIVVASSWENYLQIKEKLEQNGLSEFKDFFYSISYKRKIILINANCHGTALAKYLNLSERFKDEYILYPLMPTYLNVKGISEKLLNSTDIYIHQDIRLDNKISYYVSDEWALSKLKKGKDICIPNLVAGFGKWMFPSLGPLDKFFYDKNGVKKDVMYRDYAIDEAFNKCGQSSINDYIYQVSNYLPQNIELIWDECLRKLRERQHNWDVNIFDYIVNNYKNIPMYVDATHPSKYVMKEIGRKVAKLLDIDDIDDSNYESGLGIPVPILPKVREYYNFDFKEEIEEKNCWFRTRSNDLGLYISAYIWFYYGYIL